MSISSIHGFFELVDDVLRRGLIGVPHAKVDNIFTTRARRLLQLTNDIEDIRR